MEPFVARDGRYLFFNSLNDGVSTSLYDALRERHAFRVPGRDRGCQRHAAAPRRRREHGRVACLLLRLDAGLSRGDPEPPDRAVRRRLRDGRRAGRRGLLRRQPGGLARHGSPRSPATEAACTTSMHASTGARCRPKRGSAWPAGRVPRSSRTDRRRSVRAAERRRLPGLRPRDVRGASELYFTRIRKGSLVSEICVSILPEGAAAYSRPKRLEISGSLVEAPTLNDGTRIYYHKKTSDGRYRVFTMRRR